MTASWTGYAYLISSVLFILALRGLSSPETARRGNLMGIIGMTIAIGAAAACCQCSSAPCASAPCASAPCTSFVNIELYSKQALLHKQASQASHKQKAEPASEA